MQASNNCIDSAVASTKLIDSHCHLHSEEFAGHLDTVYKRAVMNGIQEIWLMSVDLESAYRNIEIVSEYYSDFSKKYPKLSLRLAIGFDMELLVPGSELFSEAMFALEVGQLRSKVESDLEQLYQHAKSRSVEVDIIGEIGLDYYWLGKSELEPEQVDRSKELQGAMFQVQLDYAAQKSIPVSIHSRGAEDVALQLVVASKTKNPSLSAIFHSFTGNTIQLKEILAHGFYVGVNGIATYNSAASLRADISSLAGIAGVDIIEKKLENLYDAGFFLETDAPYLIPNGSDRKEIRSVYHKEVNEPSQIIKILQNL